MANMFASVVAVKVATAYIYILSLHDALPISLVSVGAAITLLPALLQVYGRRGSARARLLRRRRPDGARDRKSTRLNSSHVSISYAVFCLKKKRKQRDCSCTKPLGRRTETSCALRAKRAWQTCLRA